MGSADPGPGGRPGAEFAAVILAGGRGRRLGGLDKPALRVGDRSLLQIALDAATGGPIVVVGPARDLPVGVRSAAEEPPGGGPAAGVAAGFLALPVLAPTAVVAVLAADLPGLAPGTLARLRAALASADAGRQGSEPPVGAVLLDASGRRQNLLGVWRHAALAAAIARRDSWHNASVREMLSTMRVVEVPGSAEETADIDTPADFRQWQHPREGPSSR